MPNTPRHRGVECELAKVSVEEGTLQTGADVRCGFPVLHLAASVFLSCGVNAVMALTAMLIALPLYAMH